VIGAGLDLGQGRRGVDMGPSAIRYAELEARIRSLGRDVSDFGDVRAPVPEAIDAGDESHRYLGPIKQVCEWVASLVDEAATQGSVPVVLGGDHSIAMGTLGGMARRDGAGAALWIDAHGDLNRPSTSPTGNVRACSGSRSRRNSTNSGSCVLFANVRFVSLIVLRASS